MKRAFLLWAAGVVFIAGVATWLFAAYFTQPVSGKEETTMMNLDLTSPAFEKNGYIPKKYTGDGQDVSPPLKWNKPPDGAQSVALVCEDPDAPMGTFVHWVAWGIKPNVTELPEAVSKEKSLPNGMKQGTNGFGRIGYGGPMPPRGTDHRYYFRLYALDTDLNLAPGANRKELEKAMQNHILAQGEYMGRYKH